MRFFGPGNRNDAALGVLVLALVLGMAGCGAGRNAGGAGDLRGQITVLAAASLTETFGQLGKSFGEQHPGATVRFSFGSSATLATSVVNGAPADVFAAASTATMDTVDTAGLARSRTDFATNVLEIAVPAGNPGRITGLADFTDPDRTIALCAPTVPCGAAAAAVFHAARLTPAPDSYEPDVKAALTKVSLGEVDAALVYATEVAAADGRVEGIAVPEADRAVTTYPIAVLTGSTRPALAEAFMAYVLSPAGRQVLADAGFGSP